MNNPEGSLTSLGAAALRAAHQLLDGEPKLLSDPVILRLLDPGHIEEIKALGPQFQHPETLRLRSRIALRSRYAEDRLMLAYARGVRQYLLLGAGLDTFAWRQPEGLDGLKIFETDHPATQEQKRQRLSRAGLSVPANCLMIAINFETETLEEALRKSSFDFAAPCFISWLGVTVYLSKEAVDAVFRFVSTLTKGSELVFTFAQKRLAGFMNHTAARAAAAGEPWQTYFRPEDLSRRLYELGFSSVHFLEPEEARATYYINRHDGLASPSLASIASAIV
jgi:methyltransferase (TIGR00027 family)